MVDMCHVSMYMYVFMQDFLHKYIHTYIHSFIHTYKRRMSAPILSGDRVDVGGQKGGEQADQDTHGGHHQREAHRPPPRVQQVLRLYTYTAMHT